MRKFGHRQWFPVLLTTTLAACGSTESSTPAADTGPDDLGVPVDVVDTPDGDTLGPDTVTPDVDVSVGEDSVTEDADIAQEDALSEDVEGEDTSDVALEDAPDSADPDVTLPDTEDPDISLPDTVDPDTVDPDTSDPDTSDPDTSDPDTSDPDTVDPDTSDPDTTDPIAPPDDLVAPPPCSAETPRRFFDRLIQAGPNGLLAAPTTASLLGDFGPALGPGTRPPAIRPGTAGEAEVLVTSAADQGCRVLGLDLDGAIAFEDSFAAWDCSSPVLLPDGFAVTARLTEEQVLRVYDHAGLLTYTLSLPGTSPATPITRGGDLYVAHGGTLSRVRPGVGVVASVTVELESLVRLAIGGDGLVVVTGRSSPLTGGLGDRLVRVATTDEPAVLTALPAIELPGAVLAETILLDGCLDPLANGSSHWWCPQGLIAAAGDGWLSVFASDTGEEVASETVLETSFTGLATLDDGRLLALGATAAGSVVRALDLQAGGSLSASLLDLSGGSPECIGSPFVDSDGAIYLTSSANIVRLTTRAGGHGPGWARAGGDAEGSGGAAALGEDCPGTDVPIFSRDSDTSFIENAYGAVALPNGDLILASDVEIAPAVRAGQLSRYTGSGFRTWSTPPSALATTFLDVTVLGNRVVALGVNSTPNPTTTEVEVYDADGNKLDADSLGAPEVYYNPVAIEPTGADTAAVLIDTTPFDASGLDATVFHYDFLGSVPIPGAGIPLDFDGTGLPMALAAKGTTLYVCGSTDVPVTGQTQSVMLRIDGDDTIPWLKQRADAATALRCHDLTLDGDTIVAIEERIASTASNVVRYDQATGDILSVTPFPGVYWHVVVPTDGRPLVAGFTYDLARLDGGAVDALGTFSVPGTVGFATDLLLVDDRPVVLGTAGVSFQDGDVRIVRPSRFGQVACGRAGRCAGATCDDADPCTVDGCNPTTGACAFTPRAEGAACGDGLTCQAGVCQ